MRRAFQAALLAVAALPFLLGLMTLLLGGSRFLPDEHVTAQLDSQLRYYSIYSALPLLMAVWIVRNLERAGPVLRIVMGATAAAGAARLLSMSEFGVPAPPMIAAVVLEVGVLVFIPWHAMVVRRSTEPPAQPSP